MSINQFSIVPCSVCPSKALFKTAFTWRDRVFCSPDCIRTQVMLEAKQREQKNNDEKCVTDCFALSY